MSPNPFQCVPTKTSRPPKTASQEFYEVPAFPRCLHGVAFQEAAAFVYDVFRALLVATDDAIESGGVHLHICPLHLVSKHSLPPSCLCGLAVGWLDKTQTANRLRFNQPTDYQPTRPLTTP